MNIPPELAQIGQHNAKVDPAKRIHKFLLTRFEGDSKISLYGKEEPDEKDF